MRRRGGSVATLSSNKAVAPNKLLCGGSHWRPRSSQWRPPRQVARAGTETLPSPARSGRRPNRPAGGALEKITSLRNISQWPHVRPGHPGRAARGRADLIRVGEGAELRASRGKGKQRAPARAHPAVPTQGGPRGATAKETVGWHPPWGTNERRHPCVEQQHGNGVQVDAKTPVVAVPPSRMSAKKPLASNCSVARPARGLCGLY